MLRELHIRNFSIIDDVTVEFGEGFNVITGETGAGKSIIIGALCLALGERAGRESIRSGEKDAIVEALFDVSPALLPPATRQFIEDSGIDISDGLVLKRIISLEGKNRAYINGSLATVQNLSDVSKSLIDIHGQYEHQSLLSSENQLDLLDAFGGLNGEREEVKRIHDTLYALRQQIAELSMKDKERARKIDMLSFQINEIDTAHLSAGEDGELEEEANVLGNAVHLAELANKAYDDLYAADSSCISDLSLILDKLKDISGIDARASEALKSVENALPLLEEAGYFLRDYRDGLHFDPARLEQVQERLEMIKGLKRKYGETIEGILNHKEKAVAELDGFVNSEEKRASMQTELDELKNSLTEKARALSAKRKKTAAKIESDVVSQLSGLSMPDTKFTIRLTTEKGDDTTDGLKVTPAGIDAVEFMISPNIGEDIKPLAKIASGGELSRIMLSLKGIMAKGDRIPVLVFDEIDAGIGGRTAETVGQRLKRLSGSHQVICITHLPQIASYGDSHLKIEKKVIKKRTAVKIARIEKDERTAEVARMLSGDVSDVSLTHARELLKKVNPG